MGYLRSCYRTTARLHPDFPPVTIRWYFAPEGAKVFDPPNKFTTNLWRAIPAQPGPTIPAWQMPQLPDKGVGEIGHQRLNVRSYNPGYLGQCFTGEAAWYSEGVPLEVLQHPETRPPWPDCCGGNVPDGGLELGTSAVEGGVEAGGVTWSEGGVEAGDIPVSPGGVEVGGVPLEAGGVEAGGETPPPPGGLEAGGAAVDLARGGVEAGGAGIDPEPPTVTCGSLDLPAILPLRVVGGTSPCRPGPDVHDAVYEGGVWSVSWSEGGTDYVLTMECVLGVLYATLTADGTFLLPGVAPLVINAGPPASGIWQDDIMPPPCTGSTILWLGEPVDLGGVEAGGAGSDPIPPAPLGGVEAGGSDSGVSLGGVEAGGAGSDPIPPAPLGGVEAGGVVLQLPAGGAEAGGRVLQLPAGGAEAGASIVDAPLGGLDMGGLWEDDMPPTGTIIASGLASGSPPAGYLYCDGSAVSRSTYSVLFTAIGTTYGAGNGTTTFNIPDLRARAPVGQAPSGLGGGRNAAVALGSTGGEQTHSLVESEMPSHQHDLTPDGGLTYFMWESDSSGSRGDTTGMRSRHTNVKTGFAGGSLAHENMPPYQAVSWFIKT